MKKRTSAKSSGLGASSSPSALVDASDSPIRGTGVVSFSGHETFTMRHGWLKKAADAVQENPHIFANENAMVELGVGKNMVRSIRHWALAAEVLQEMSGTRGAELGITHFGSLLFGEHGYDPFMEDTNTLWLIHWKLATNERRSTAWRWMFNLLHRDEFTRDSLIELLKAELKRRNIADPSLSSLERDIDCALRTYVGTRTKIDISEDSLECPLVELQLITADPDGIMFRFSRGPQSSLSNRVFLHCLLEFWEAHGPQESLASSEIAFAPGSPGLVFKLDENSIAYRLEQLDKLTKGALIYDETAGLKQIYRRSKIDKWELLAHHYHESVALIGD